MSPSSRSNASCTWRSLTASNELVASSSRSTLQRCLGNMDQFMPSRKTYWIHEEPACFRMVIHWWDMLYIVTIVMLQVFVRPVNFNFNVFTSWVWVRIRISVQGFKLCNSRTAGSLKSARAIAMRCFLRFDQRFTKQNTKWNTKFLTTFTDSTNNSNHFSVRTLSRWAFQLHHNIHKDTESRPETLETTQDLGKKHP